MCYKYRTITFSLLIRPCFLAFYTTNCLQILYPTNFLVENVFIYLYMYLNYISLHVRGISSACCTVYKFLARKGAAMCGSIETVNKVANPTSLLHYVCGNIIHRTHWLGCYYCFETHRPFCFKGLLRTTPFGKVGYLVK